MDAQPLPPRSLRPLEKTRAFRMTPTETSLRGSANQHDSLMTGSVFLPSHCAVRYCLRKPFFRSHGATLLSVRTDGG